MSKTNNNRNLLFADFKATLKRTERKNIEIQVKPDNTIIVLAPIKIKLAQIRCLVDKKVEWIKSKRLARSFEVIKKKKDYISGESFLLFGQTYSLKIKDHGEKSNLIHNGVNFELKPKASENGEKWFILFYKKRAKEFLIPRVSVLAKQLGYETGKIRVMELQGRWGSCTSNNTINLSWRLSMLPNYVIDYIIIHELTHTEIKNHTEEFWKKVEFAIPTYRDADKWLSKNGHNVFF